MTTRVLPREEYGRLAPTLLGGIPLPADAIVVVVEADGEIIGCSALFQQWHQEGTWIAPSHQGRAAVGRCLLSGITQGWRDAGACEVRMMSLDPEISTMITRRWAAQALPADHFIVRGE